MTNCKPLPINNSNLPKQNDNKVIYPKLKGLKFAHVNITSLPKHLDELKLFLQQLPFEILSLNETRLGETIQNNMVQIPGYEIIRRDRNRRGGGVAFLVKNNYSYTLRDDLISKDLEAICIESGVDLGFSARWSKFYDVIDDVIVMTSSRQDHSPIFARV